MLCANCGKIPPYFPFKYCWYCQILAGKIIHDMFDHWGGSGGGGGGNKD